MTQSRGANHHPEDLRSVRADRMRPGRRALRLSLLFVCFGLSSAAVLLGGYGAMNAAGVERPDIGLDAMSEEGLGSWLRKLARPARGSRLQRIAFLGDSTVVSYPHEQTVPTRLQQATARLTRGAPPIWVKSLAMPGMGPFEWYFVSDEIARSKPDQVVLPVNLANFSEASRKLFARTELAGWIRPRRLPEALGLPLHHIGLTADQLLFYVGIVRAGAYAPWHLLKQEQARMGRARQALAEWIGGESEESPEELFQRAQKLDSLARFLLPGGERYNARGVRRHLGAVLDGIEDDHPVLQILAATVRVFRRAGIHVLVYVVPANLEHVEALGLLDEEGLEKTLVAIERAVRPNGAQFTDLHQLLPDQGFRDPAGHFAIEAEIDGPSLLAEALAPLVVSQAKHAAAAAR